MKSCESFTWDLNAYAEGTLSPEKRPQLEAHLAECPQCAELAGDLVKVVKLLRSVPAIPVEDSFTEDVMDVIQKDPRQDKAAWPGYLQWAAAILVVLGIGALSFQFLKPTGQEGDQVAKAPAPRSNNFFFDKQEIQKKETPEYDRSRRSTLQRNRMAKTKPDADKGIPMPEAESADSMGIADGVKAKRGMEASSMAPGEAAMNAAPVIPGVTAVPKTCDYAFQLPDTKAVRQVLSGLKPALADGTEKLAETGKAGADQVYLSVTASQLDLIKSLALPTTTEDLQRAKGQGLRKSAPPAGRFSGNDKEGLFSKGKTVDAPTAAPAPAPAPAADNAMKVRQRGRQPGAGLAGQADKPAQVYKVLITLVKQAEPAESPADASKKE